MPKIYSPEPVFIHNLKELKKFEFNINRKQYVQYHCNICNKLYSKPLYRLKKSEYQLLCNACLYKQNCLKKYGVENPSQLQAVKDKKKETCAKHYGVENPTFIPSHVEKIKQTSLRKYGTLHPKQSPIVQEKYKQTCLKRYGVESINQVEFVKNKKKETTFQHYGVENPMQCNDVKQVQKSNYKQTCLEKYGVDHPWKNWDIKEKIKQTNLKKFGVKNPALSEKIQEKMQQKANSLEVLRKRQTTNLYKFVVRNPAQSEEIKKIIQQKLNSLEVREKYKQTMLQRYGSLHTSSNKFKYKGQSFDSSWELAVWVWANETGKQIKREPIGLEYEFENKTHTYYPDFIIDNQLVEIKGNHFFNKAGEMQNPYDHGKDSLFEAKHQCGVKHSVQFWTEKEMKPILDYMKEKYGPHWKNKFKK